MNVEEIKSRYKMSDIVKRYGLKETRQHFIRCPFHAGDKNPSLKIYEDSFYCFGCHANGDIFNFVELMEDCSFKDAFLALGGTYDKPKPSDLINQYRLNKLRASRQRKQQQQADKKKELVAEITKCQEIIDDTSPFSDEWTKAKRRLLVLLAELDEGGEKYL